MKFLFEYLTDSFSLFSDPINNYIAMAVVGAVAYTIAYNLVGKLYRSDMIDGRGAGHFLHWIIRLVVFGVIFYAAATIIRVYFWFCGLPDVKWWIIGSVIGISVIGIIAIKVIQYRRESQ